MARYIEVLLTKDGYFCVAPPWSVKEGDLVYLTDDVTGEEKILEVIAVATDEADGNHFKMLEKYIGYPLPRIKAMCKRKEIEWDEPVQE